MFTNIFTLTDKDPDKSFLFDFSFSHINIKRIEAISLLGKKPDEWFPELGKMTLLFTYKDREQRTISFPINLSAQARLDQWQPIIEFREFVVPEENKNNMTTLGNYVTQLSIKLIAEATALTPIELRIHFEKTPGVK